MGNLCHLRRARNSSCSCCNVKGHVTAMCPVVRSGLRVDTCLHTNDYQYSFMSPVISVTVGEKNKWVKINCLLHTGSQRTYLDTFFLERLNCLSLAKERVLEVKTFLGNGMRPFKETSFKLGHIPGKVPPNFFQ